jgi:glycosyltransferase involved in cell wall biosynthesis
MLQALVAKLGTPDVHFLGHVSNEELTALYDVADLFLCASEHEGFCVPLIEAMAADVPVLAFASTAVPETLGGAGVLFDDKDMKYVAELLGQLAFDPVMRQRVVARQRTRLGDFSDDRLAAQLQRTIELAAA